MKTNTDIQSSNSLPASAAAISTEGMTRPSDDSQSTAEDYSINVEGPDCTDAAPCSGSSLDGALGHDVFTRDFSQYNLPNPSAQPIIRAHSFGDDRRASACMFRRRALSSSGPFLTITPTAYDNTADMSAVADEDLDTSNVPRLSIPPDYMSTHPRNSLYPIETSLPLLSPSPQSPFLSPSWRSSGSDTSSVRSVSPSPSLLPSPSPSFLSPEHAHHYRDRSPGPYGRSRSSSHSLTYAASYRDGDSALGRGRSLYRNEQRKVHGPQPSVGSSIGEMDDMLGSMQLRETSVGRRVISREHSYHYGLAAGRHQYTTQGSTFQTDPLLSSVEVQTYPAQEVVDSTLLFPGPHISSSSSRPSSPIPSFTHFQGGSFGGGPFEGFYPSASSSSSSTLSPAPSFAPFEGELVGSDSYPAAFPSPFPAMLQVGDDNGQLHTRLYASAGTTTTGSDGGISDWGALTNQAGHDPLPFYGLDIRGISAEDLGARLLGSWDGAFRKEAEDLSPAFRPHIGTENTRRAADARRKNPNGKRFICDLCPSTFTAKHNLLNHINSHKSLRPYGCSKCRMCFGTKHVMLRHESKCRRSLLSRKKRMS